MCEVIWQVREVSPKCDHLGYDYWAPNEEAALTFMVECYEIPRDGVVEVTADRPGRRTWLEPSGTQIHLDRIELPTETEALCELVNRLIDRACTHHACDETGDLIVGEYEE